MYTCICKHIYIPQSNLIRLYITRMYDFRANNLVLDNEFKSCFMGVTISSCQHSLIAYSLLCRVEYCALSPVHLSMSVVVLVHLMFS